MRNLLRWLGRIGYLAGVVLLALVGLFPPLTYPLNRAGEGGEPRFETSRTFLFTLRPDAYILWNKAGTAGSGNPAPIDGSRLIAEGFVCAAIMLLSKQVIAATRQDRRD